MENCKEEGCEKPAYCKGLCNNHYKNKWYRERVSNPLTREQTLLSKRKSSAKHHQRNKREKNLQSNHNLKEIYNKDCFSQPNRGLRWTVREECFLLENPDMEVEELMSRLGRSYQAIIQKRHFLSKG